MGEARKDALRVVFDRSLKLEFHGSTIRSDAGLLAYCELDEVFAFIVLAQELLRELRTGRYLQHSLTALLRQSNYSRLAGYGDTNDAQRRRCDPCKKTLVLIKREAPRGRSAHRYEKSRPRRQIAQGLGHSRRWAGHHGRREIKIGLAGGHRLGIMASSG